MNAPPKSKYYVPSDRFEKPLFDYVIKRFPKPLSCLFIIVFMTLVTPFIPLLAYRQHRRRLWFAKTLGAQGRVMTWNEFLQRMPGAGGTVIIEMAIKGAFRYWWTPDDVRKSTPVAPPPWSESSLFDSSGSNYHPFTRWCYENYLNPIDGRAVLVWPVEARIDIMPHGEDVEKQMRERFPDQDIIILPVYDSRYF